MKERHKQNIIVSQIYIKTMFKWMTCAVITGLICGTVGTLFNYAVKYATDYRLQNGWLIFVLPISGIIIVFTYKLAKLDTNTGTNLIIESIRSSEKLPIVLVPLIFIGTVLTHLCGGSSGREGAALQIGGCIGAWIGRIIKLDERDIKIITLCGMSAVFSALFGTPLTATIFSMEVISVGVIYYVAFLPCIIASLTATAVASYAGVDGEHYYVADIPSLSFDSVLKVAVLGVLCAGLSILFIICLHKANSIYQHYCENEYIRIFIGAILVILLTFIVGNGDYNGAGMSVIKNAFEGNSRPEAFILKIVFTVVTLGAGFKGGEIVPTFFIGATFGNFAASLIGIDTGFGAAIGLIATFCGVVNSPFTSLVLSVELFGSSNLVLFGIACAISYMLSGYYSLYSSQKIVYSKLHPLYIDRNTK